MHVCLRAQRARIRAEIAIQAQAVAAERYAQACQEQRRLQADADWWWHALNAGDPAVVSAGLIAAFADNPAPVEVLHAAGQAAILRVWLPGIEVLPEKTGSPSTGKRAGGATTPGALTFWPAPHAG